MALYRGSLHALLPLSSVSFPMCGCEHLWNLCDEWTRQERRQGNVSHCTTGVSKRKKKKRTNKGHKAVCVCLSLCVCACVCGEGMGVRCTWTAYKSTNVHSALHLCPHCQGCRVCMNLNLCVRARAVRVHRLVSARTRAQGRDRLNLYSWSVPRRD